MYGLLGFMALMVCVGCFIGLMSLIYELWCKKGWMAVMLLIALLFIGAYSGYQYLDNEAKEWNSQFSEYKGVE